jgi:hypothetical protein
MGHAQAKVAPTDKQIAEMVAFEVGIFNAQHKLDKAGILSANGGKGGAINLSDHRNDAPAFPAPPDFAFIGFNEFNGWANAPGDGSSKKMRDSVARGQALFNGNLINSKGEKRGGFTVNGVAGFNNVVGPNAAATCSTCHNFTNAGSDILPAAQRDIGVGGQGSEKTGAQKPFTHLPVFQVSNCQKGDFLWDPEATSTKTNDLGKAMLTGDCKDLGSSTVPQLRALSSREPYFRDGSAKTLKDVVNFYNVRFKIGLTKEEQDDLTNFLSAL